MIFIYLHASYLCKINLNVLLSIGWVLVVGVYYLINMDFILVS